MHCRWNKTCACLCSLLLARSNRSICCILSVFPNFSRAGRAPKTAASQAEESQRRPYFQVKEPVDPPAQPDAGHKCKKISIFNPKGGVGKTTVAVNLAATLARQGFKVCLWDADGQCNATSSLHPPLKRVETTHSKHNSGLIPSGT